MSFDPQPAISVLQLRISLRGLSPPVWRRVLVPEHFTLAQLHNVIQVVMGWTDEHPHQFTVRGRRYGEAHEGVLQFSTVANELALTEFGLREHEGFIYVYDFNAWWRHDTRVERRLLRQQPAPLPRCVAGCGPCPPEDIGGIEGYLEARKSVANTSLSSGSSRCARVQSWWTSYATRSTNGWFGWIGASTVGPPMIACKRSWHRLAARTCAGGRHVDQFASRCGYRG